MAVFQPGEETAQGAQAMIDDNLFKRFAKPDVVLGQHVMSLPSGISIGVRELLLQLPTACKFVCSAVARTARCPRLALIPSSWLPRPG